MYVFMTEYLCTQEEFLSIRRRFEDGDVVEHLAKKLTRCKAKRVREGRKREMHGDVWYSCMYISMDL